MADTEPLFALLELMLRTFTRDVPKMKAGGHPEDLFVDLSQEERDEIECSICYQILKDVRQCENKHKFCYSCIFVWSTSGNPVNHSRCPVCRVEGLYVKNNSLDEKINSKTVKCSMKTCKWTGALKLLPSHLHTTYSETNATRSNEKTDDKPTELPTVRNNATQRPVSKSRSRSLASTSQNSIVSSATGSSTTLVQRQPLGTSSLNNSNNSVTNNVQTTNRNTTSNQRTTGHGTTRSRTRSRHRQNSSSPQRRSNVTATGLNSRLTSRARIQNSGAIENRPVNTQTIVNQSVLETDENQNPNTEQTTTEPIHVPHPPTTPRPATQTPRRLPTLPNLIPLNNANTRNADNQNLQTDNNNNVNTPTTASITDHEAPRRFPIQEIRRPTQPRSFGIIRERLNESRQRLDMLMTVFSTELDRGRQDLTAFQQERELRRQEQLAEVRDLGRRLTQVAQELRGLLSQRRQIRTQMDNLLESGSDD